MVWFVDWRPRKATEGGAYRFLAAWWSDHLFFDVQGMLNNRQFTESDFFADKQDAVHQ